MVKERKEKDRNGERGGEMQRRGEVSRVNGGVPDESTVQRVVSASLTKE